jgi:periplasmic divalent cation tolerance protein
MFDPIGSPPTCVEVVVTARDAGRLAAFTRSLVEDGLVACGQTVAPVQVLSMKYGEVRDETRARVALHTRHSLVSDVVARVERDGDDDVPSVVATRLIDGSTDYLQWIVHQTAGAQHGAGARR